MFDAPSREFCTARRVRTNTPLQALTTLNDPVFVEAARALAARTLREAAAERGGSAPRHAFRLCTSRRRRPEDAAPLLAFQAEQPRASSGERPRRPPLLGESARQPTPPSWRPGPSWPTCC